MAKAKKKSGKIDVASLLKKQSRNLAAVYEVRDDADTSGDPGELAKECTVGAVLGAKVTKGFEVDGSTVRFDGTVVELWLDDDLKTVAHVIYDDGDEEDLYLSQITSKRAPPRKRAKGGRPPSAASPAGSGGEPGAATPPSADEGDGSRAAPAAPAAPVDARPWQKSGSGWIGVRCAMGLRSAETGDVEAWLSAADSAYKDEFGHSAPLWRVRGPRGTTAILELNELKCCVDTQSPRA